VTPGALLIKWLPRAPRPALLVLSANRCCAAGSRDRGGAEIVAQAGPQLSYLLPSKRELGENHGVAAPTLEGSQRSCQSESPVGEWGRCALSP
jgi:hypothetical protein